MAGPEREVRTERILQIIDGHDSRREALFLDDALMKDADARRRLAEAVLARVLAVDDEPGDLPFAPGQLAHPLGVGAGVVRRPVLRPPRRGGGLAVPASLRPAGGGAGRLGDALADARPLFHFSCPAFIFRIPGFAPQIVPYLTSTMRAHQAILERSGIELAELAFILKHSQLVFTVFIADLNA